LGEGFAQWRAFNRTQKDLNIGRLFQRATPSMSDEEAAAYDAPFPDASYKAGVRKFPDLVMTDPDMEGVAEAKQAREWWGSTWHGASFMAIGMADPVLGEPIMRELQQTINGCSEPLEIEDGGHFVQESGDLIAQRALQYFDEQGA
jgi:pimeloyl-ACP methyl ester carboxylesterase